MGAIYRMTENVDSVEQILIREQIQLIYSQQEKMQRLEEAYWRKCSEYNEVIGSKAWRITGPLRFAGNTVKWMLGMLPAGYSPWSAIAEDHRRKKTIARAKLFSREELKEQTKYAFEKDVRISIVVPLYNTPELFLREMIESVRAQTYRNWELCMADGSDANHQQVEKICCEYEKRDNRIHYRRLKRNNGISANTNAALEMVTGDYVGFLDHDDMLHPAALHEVMLAICEQDADLVYTDEAHFHTTPKDADNPHFKPDYAPDTLCSNNYICHFTVFRRTLLDQCGTFAPECDGSQDHDMILRLTEKAERISHIPEILYYWREHDNSVASNLGIKPYVFEAGIRANERRLYRLGLGGYVSTAWPGSPTYRIRYEITGNPYISVIIRAGRNSRGIWQQVYSVLKKTGYENYEIIIAEEGDVVSEATQLYDSLLTVHQNIRVIRTGGFGDSQAWNEAVRQSSGDYIVLLNEKLKILTSGWLEEMLMYCQRPDIGAAGVKIVNPDGIVRHAGIGLGMCDSVGWFFRGVGSENRGYMDRLVYAQNVSAVSGGCVMLSRKAWTDVNGLDEAFSDRWNVIDLCLRLRKAGYLNIWTPFAELECYEFSQEYNLELKDSDEGKRFMERWREELEAGDPYYNPNLDHDREDFLPAARTQRQAARCVINRRMLSDSSGSPRLSLLRNEKGRRGEEQPDSGADNRFAFRNDPDGETSGSPLRRSV